MTERRPIPADFAQQRARLGAVKKLRRHYNAGQEVVLRWLHESGLPRMIPRPTEPLRCKRPDCNNVIRNRRSATGLCLAHYKELRRANMTAVPAPRPKHLLSTIVARTAERFGVKPSDLTGPSRKRCHVRPRQVAFYLSHHMTALSMTETGRRMNRDHSTVMHGVETCAQLMRDDREFRGVVRDIICALKGRAVNPSPVEPIRLECMGHNYKRQEPKSEPVEFRAPWWELTDDELMARNIADYRAAGGSFVEVHA